MRKYDREKKEWVSEEELIRRTKARQKCKNGQEHDYVEVLPYGASANDDYRGSVEPYYDAHKRLNDFAEKLEAELLEKGIVTKMAGYRPFRDYRNLICAVCKKRTTRSVKED